MVFGWGESHDAYNEVYQDKEHDSSLSHEVLAGGASFAAFHEFEEKQRRDGKPVSHEFAKELLAGFAGAEVDKLVETKGLDFVDREKAKHQAKENAKNLYDQQYGGDDEYNPRRGPPERLQQQFGGYDGGY